MPTKIDRSDFIPLLTALAHFSKTTNKFFYYFLEKAVIQESDDGWMQFGYEGTDEEGSKKVFFVTLEGGSLRLARIKNMIAGVNKDGSPVKGSMTEIHNMFISASHLLMAEIGKVSEKTGLPIGRIIYEPSEFSTRLSDVRKNPKTDEYDVYVTRQ